LERVESRGREKKKRGGGVGSVRVLVVGRKEEEGGREGGELPQS